MSRTTRHIALIVALLSVFALPGFATANHSWGGYHWARTTTTFTLQLGSDVSTAWHDGTLGANDYLATTASDWSVSTVLDTTIVAGAGASKRRCPWTSGRVEVCDYAYGYNGWLGVAQIYVSGSHITQGQVRLNDSYFNTSTYNTPAWRNMVMCQEVGHTLGLDHQDTNFYNTNLGTCMDYTNAPARDDGVGDNEHPNAHDYDELAIIYEHGDSTTTVAALPVASAAAGPAAGWGRLVASAHGGRTSTYVRDLGNGQKVVTFVIWTD